jgi:ABC-2 type transport system permease protein
MVVAWRQFKALFSIYIQDGLAYKASAVIWVMTDVATAATMPMVMMAATKGGNIKGFTGSDFVLYYLTMLLVTCFVQCHFMWDVSMEIKEGVFSSQIIRPVNYIYYHAVRNFAWRIFRTAIFSPIFLLILWAYSSWIVSPQIHLTWYSILAVLLGHFLSYFFVMAMGMLALFLQEKISEGEMREKLFFEIWHYAKRQLSFIRRMEKHGLAINWAHDTQHALQTIIEQSFRPEKITL